MLSNNKMLCHLWDIVTGEASTTMIGWNGLQQLFPIKLTTFPKLTVYTYANNSMSDLIGFIAYGVCELMGRLWGVSPYDGLLFIWCSTVHICRLLGLLQFEKTPLFS